MERLDRIASFILRVFRRWNLLLQCFAGGTCFYSINAFAVSPLSLDECLSIGRKNNPRLIQAEKSIESARAGIMAAYSPYYPDIDLSGGYKRGTGYTGDGNYSTSIGLQYLLYQGGYVRASTEIAKHRLKIAEQNYRLVESEVSFSIKEAFFRILQKMEQFTVVDKILKRRKDALVLIKLKYEAGRESSPAVGEAEADLLQAEYDKIASEEELSLARVKLNLLLGRPAREEISVKYKDKDMDFPPRKNLIEEAKAQKPEICIEKASRKVLQAQLRQAKSNYFPKLSLSSSYGYSGSVFLDQTDNWSAGLSLTFPIFNGFSTRAKVREAVSAIQEEDAKIQSIEQKLEEEVEEAYSNWILANKNFEVNEKALQAARDMYQFTKLQYEQGRTPYFFLQQKEASLTRAENNYTNALFNLRVSCARLQKAWGK